MAKYVDNVKLGSSIERVQMNVALEQFGLEDDKPMVPRQNLPPYSAARFAPATCTLIMPYILLAALRRLGWLQIRTSHL